MKIWMKVLLGTILGTVLGFLLPTKDAKLGEFLSFAFKLVVHAGQYVLFPLVFFSASVAVYQLKEDKRLGGILFKTVLVMIAFTAGLSLFGIATVLLASPARIPLVSAGNPDSDLEELSQSVFSIFPENVFSVFAQPGNFLLPLVFLALVLGLTFSSEKSASKPILTLFDSFSRIFYRINDLFSEFLGIGVIVLSVYGIGELKTSMDTQIYGNLLLIIALDILIVALVIVPLVLYFTCGRKNPFKWIYALVAPAMIGLLSGNVNLALCTLFKHQKESLGVRRRANSISIPIAAMFGRGGTALVSAVSFLVVLKSYSSLGVSVRQVIWVIAASVLVSFFLGSAPGSGVLAAVSILCSVFGRGFEASYLIIKPIGFALVAGGACLDVIVAASVSFIVARMEGFQEDREMRYYI